MGQRCIGANEHLHEELAADTGVDTKRSEDIVGGNDVVAAAARNTANVDGEARSAEVGVRAHQPDVEVGDGRFAVGFGALE